MIRVACGLIAAVLICAFSLSDTTAQVALNRKKLPIYYKEQSDKGLLEIEFSEKGYNADQPLAKYGRFAANVAVEANKESTGAEETVIGYLNGVLGGDYEQLARFYVPGAESESTIAAARDLRKEVAGLTEVRFLSEWFYSSAKFVLARLMFESRQPRILGFGFRDTAKGFLLADDWGPNDDSVHGLFRHILSEMHEGRTAEYGPRSFEHSIEVLPGIFGAAINVDGRVYDPADWITLGRGGSGRSLTSFVELVLGTADALDDAAFTSLWCPTARAELRARAKNQPAGLTELRRAHAARRPIKHVMTMDFAENHAHYFVEQHEPTELRTIFVAKEGERFCLSQGPDYPELYSFLVSQPVRVGVWKLWAGRS